MAEAGSDAGQRTTARPSPRDDEAVRRFIEHSAATWADWGFPRMAARMLFTLLADDRPGLTAAELGDLLDASPAAVSGAVRYLNLLGMVTRRSVPGSRRDLHCLRDDAWYAGIVAQNGMLREVTTSCADAVGAVGGELTPAGARLAEMRDFFAFMEGEMDTLMAKWHATRAQRGAAPDGDRAG